MSNVIPPSSDTPPSASSGQYDPSDSSATPSLQPLPGSSPQPQRAEAARLHHLLLGDTLSIRQYDLLTDDHPHRWYDPREPLRCRAWSRGIAFVGILLGIMLAVSFVGVVVITLNTMASGASAASLSVDITSMSTSSPMIMLSSTAELIAAVAAYLIVTLVMERRRPPVELSPRRAFGAIRGMIAAFACIAVCVGVIALFGGYRIVGFDPDYSPWADLLTLGFTAGIAEEIMMRGILLRLTEESLGSWGAVILSAFVFGIIHWFNRDGTLWGGLAIAIEAGLLFGAIYLATRSLWWCMGFHFMWNIAEGPIFGSIVSGNGEQHSWLVAQWNGPAWLTGGSFGLEASIVPVILLGGIAVAILVHLQRLGLMIEPIKDRKRRFGIPA
ncbi:CPBP family intramembrane glutamic endopeptidase [Bifidobacterium biavatii]|uniref:Abortive infection protein n=1 Tax=Bifidobacterium biavatii DSM 23969 TaxID=1437608 RepID=A0A086ZEJ6_9BIFI|nr:CPBP family intramembrane glutamic endopeptidase [Bifidobacterium biavatii]KFI44946.1 abortive infection protein [Bifidobacterium biavatii DSM 23969]